MGYQSPFILALAKQYADAMQNPGTPAPMNDTATANTAGTLAPPLVVPTPASGTAPPPVDYRPKGAGGRRLDTSPKGKGGRLLDPAGRAVAEAGRTGKATLAALAPPDPESLLAYQMMAQKMMQPEVDKMLAAQRTMASMVGDTPDLPPSARAILEQFMPAQAAATQQWASSYQLAAQALPYLAQQKLLTAKDAAAAKAAADAQQAQLDRENAIEIAKIQAGIAGGATGNPFLDLAPPS